MTNSGTFVKLSFISDLILPDWTKYVNISIDQGEHPVEDAPFQNTESTPHVFTLGVLRLLNEEHILRVDLLNITLMVRAR